MVPLLHGFVSIKAVTINKKRFKFALISRRSCYRAGERGTRRHKCVLVNLTGVRYYVRGVDEEGRVANFVETEQLVLYGGMVGSFIQVSHHCCTPTG